MTVADLIGFRRSDLAPLARAVEQVLRRGTGWINVQPDLDDVDPRAHSRPSFFSGRGRVVPLSTFVPSSGGGEHQVGVEHGAGKHAARQLHDAGVAFPDGSRLVQDHPRRGLVIAVPNGTAPTAIAALLVQAGSHLTVVPLGDRWIAEIY
ncbi:MAG: hypothetical protein IT196_15530 [Acidimicrobiales bacterium]|nr:hypothetical protein [Acidimicrobiales bacterium]